MASTRFTVLTGHLSQYSLADLLGILRHQRKTGRLLIEYIGSPAILFFRDGNLVDAQYNNLIGVQAIFVAFVQPPAAFNFNPLIQPTRDSIDFEQQRVILELLGCWTEDPILIKSVTRIDELPSRDVRQPELPVIEPQLALPSGSVPKSSALPEAHTVLSLPAARSKRGLSFRSNRRPWILAIATFVLLLIFGVPTLIAINNKTRKANSTPPAAKLQGADQITPSTAVGNNGSPIATPAVERTTNVAEAKHDQLAQSSKESEQLSNKARTDEVQKNNAAEPVPVKESGPSTTSPSEPIQADKAKQAQSNGQTVKVVMRIENGRVVQAMVGDRQPGAEAYEALALRIARQRRYPAGVNKQETMVMKVDGPK